MRVTRRKAGYNASRWANAGLSGEKEIARVVNQSHRPRAVLLDFYGTIVEEDDAPIRKICDGIAEASPLGVSPADVGAH